MLSMKQVVYQQRTGQVDILRVPAKFQEKSPMKKLTK
jgi:hypothetical protein